MKCKISPGSKKNVFFLLPKLILQTRSHRTT